MGLKRIKRHMIDQEFVQQVDDSVSTLNNHATKLNDHDDELAAVSTQLAETEIQITNKTAGRVNLKEYENLIPNKAMIPDPVNWDWEIPMQQAVNDADDIFIPDGIFFMSSFPVLTTRKHIHGAGSSLFHSTSKTVLRFPAGVKGITTQTNDSAFTVIENLCLHSLSTTLGTDDGIVLGSNRVTIRNVLVQGFGRHGINIDSTNGNVNLCNLENVRSYQNKGRGFSLSGGVDNNVLTLHKCDATGNGDWGFYNTARHSILFNCHASQNTGGGFYDNGISNVYYMPYVEEGVGNFSTIDASSSYGIWIATFYAAIYPSVHANARTSWFIQHQSGFTRKLTIHDNGGPSSGKNYEFDNGVFNAGAFRLRNVTDNKNIFDVNSTLTRFMFHLPIGFTPVTASATNNTSFLDSADNILKHRDNAGRTGNMSRFVAVPASATATGTPGDWSADANYMYVCHTANTWKRVAIATW
ncbi:hypothetical protein BAOM_3138 [Peribacillus asahii]|uniref:Right handed beta helix domain-containing protein n=1 Tax=Peribacillus asahii TaxID=228899 RepID=A0A3Q9RPG1_9BACI|nr:right-handed parallel beta-helix repeat-containing protein [Peribacillus asahii]AZV43747.1 hypothetical protein BAOM_3138 [Peribacillus asahii]